VELPDSASGRSAEEIAREAARLAREIILPRFQQMQGGSPIEKVSKGRGNYVTETDLMCEEAVLGLLRREFPEHKLLAEATAEAVEDWQTGWLWVIDPLDGTGNFARGIPTFAFNIALCWNGRPVVGLTDHIVSGDEFIACEGGGLFINGVRTTVSPQVILGESVTGFGLGYDYERAGAMLHLLSSVWPAVQMLQNIGSAALGLAYAASGRFDLYIHHYVFPWDIAAGIVQVREAGGLILDRDGGEIGLYSEGLIAGAPGPVREFLEMAGAYPWR